MKIEGQTRIPHQNSNIGLSDTQNKKLPNKPISIPSADIIRQQLTTITAHPRRKNEPNLTHSHATDAPAKSG